MKRRTVNIIIGVVGVSVLVVIGVIAFGAYLAMSTIHSEESDEATAVTRIAEVRQRFAGGGPAFEIRDGEPRLLRQPPGTPPSTPVTTLHILRWNRADRELTNVTLPFSVLRMTTDPIRFSEEGQARFELAVEDVERYGPALLLDHEDNDGPLIVWTD